MKTENSHHTFQEIISQPQAWEAVLGEVSGKSKDLLNLWKPEEIDEVIFTGCGSTFYLSRTAAMIFQGKVGSLATAYPASELLLFPNLTLSKARRRLLVAISRSGETTETLRAIDSFRSLKQGDVIGITCYEESTLPLKTTLALVARKAKEESIAQTRSFTSMLVAAQSMASILSSQEISKKSMQLPELGTALIQEYASMAQALGNDPQIERFFFLGNGPYYGLACETMLKMKEMSLSYSEAYHFLEFRHGPMSMVNSNTLVVGLLSETALLQEAAVLKDMHSLGARVLAVTPTRISSGEIDHQIVLPTGLSDLERGPLYLPILQLLAFYRALYNGQSPDQPNNLSAVVHLDFESL